MNLFGILTWLAVCILGPGSLILFIVLLVHLRRHLRDQADP